jgi:hypothetical protein
MVAPNWYPPTPEPGPLDPRAELADWDERFRKAHPGHVGLGDHVAENIRGATIRGIEPRFVVIRDGQLADWYDKRPRGLE